MPKYNTYGLDATISSSDILLGSDNGGTSKNYSMSALVAYLAGQITLESLTLQGYSETGVRASGTLVVTLGDYDDSGNSTKVVIDDANQIIDLFNSLRLNGGTGTATFNASALTAARTLTLQDASGTIALTSDVFDGTYASLTGKPTIPTQTSELTNNGNGVSAFALVSQLAVNVSDLANDAGYITSAPTLTSQLTNDSGFITSAAVPTLTSQLTNDGSDATSTYVENDEIATVATTGDYTDLINTPTSPAQVSVVSKTGNYTAQNGEYVICDASSAGFTITLPVATANYRIQVKKKDSSTNIVTVDANGSETIDGELSQALDAQWDSLTVVSDGTEWFIE